MNHETQTDKARESSDNRLIDESFSYEDDSDLIDTPSVMAAYAADELFHKMLRQQAGEAS